MDEVQVLRESGEIVACCEGVDGSTDGRRQDVTAHLQCSSQLLGTEQTMKRVCITKKNYLFDTARKIEMSQKRHYA